MDVTVLKVIPMKRTTNRLSWPMILCLQLALPAASADEFSIDEVRNMSLDDILQVNISTGTQKPLARTPTTTSMVTAQDIERMGAVDVFDVLEMIPGVHVYPAQDGAMSAAVDIRGLHSVKGAQVLFLRDGKPVRSVEFAAQPEIFRMSAQLIERIEVIRGPGSALYGADAFAGVINVITKKNANMLGARGGSFGSAEGWLGKSGSLGPINWDMLVDYSRSDGDSSRIFRHDFLSVAGQPSWSPGVLATQFDVVDAQLRLSSGPFSSRFWLWDSRSGFGLSPGNTYAPNNTVSSATHLAELTYEDKVSTDGNLKTSFTYSDFAVRREASVLPAGAFGYYLTDVHQMDKVKEERLQFDSAYTYTGFNRHRLRVASGWMGESLASPTFIFSGITLPPSPPVSPLYLPHSRDLGYFALQDEYAFARDWELTAGIRYDHYSDFGDVANPRAGLVWTATSSLTAKLIYGEAFRAPAFAELYKIAPGITGNPDLRPEKQRSVELSLDYHPTERLHTALALYRYLSTELIQSYKAYTNPEHPLGGVYNDRSQLGMGAEWELGYALSEQLRIDTSLAYNNSLNDDTEQRIAFTPRWSAKTMINWQFQPQWNLNLRVRAYMDRVRSPQDLGPPIPDYQLVDLTLGHRLNSHASVSLSVQNLIDSKAYEPSISSVADDFRLPGRSFLGKVEYRF
ncbi:MAG: TonB-dependent receptor [Methylococcaceae bacterium]|nr:MAG: TonB-dependent receptor [Methylococcaceae bacterium]